MKKGILLLLLILCVACVFVFVRCNFDKDADTEPTESASSEVTESVSDSDPETETGTEPTEGGNPASAASMDVTVSGDKYIFDNQEISYDDLIKVFDDLKENTVVKLKDDNATRNAYEKLTKALDERKVLYEKEN